MTIVFVKTNLFTLAVYLSGSLFCDFFLSKIKLTIRTNYIKLKHNINNGKLLKKINIINTKKNIL